MLALAAAGCSAQRTEGTTVIEESNSVAAPAVDSTEPETEVIELGAETEVIELGAETEEPAAEPEPEPAAEIDETDPWDSYTGPPTKRRVAIAIATLQPWWLKARTRAEHIRRRDHAHQIAGAIRRAALRHDFDPILGVAIARRESSLLPWFGEGRIRHGKRAAGPAGERGYFQIYPEGAAEGRCGDCDQYDPECSAETAFCWLAHLREVCRSSDLWVLVGAYGRSRCPRSADEARDWPEVRRARRFYCEALVNGECDRRWPWPRIVEARR
jgi:hypothetical protein